MSYAVNTYFRQIAEQCLQQLLPARCLLCNQHGVAGQDLCADCSAQLPWHGNACVQCALPLALHDGAQKTTVCGACLRKPPPLQRVYAAFVYRAPLNRLLPRLKFHQSLACARLLSNAMLQCARHWPQPQALVAIPLHRARLRQRGFDQALELAKPLANALGCPLRSDLLQRDKATSAQTQLDIKQRARNLRGAFSVPANARAIPSHITLIDDVMTTGATLHAAANALHNAGVARVDAWLCARAVLP